MEPFTNSLRLRMSGQNWSRPRRLLLGEIKDWLDGIAYELAPWVRGLVVVSDKDGGYFTGDPRYTKRMTYEQIEERVGFSVRCGTPARDLLYEYRFDFIEDPGIWWWTAEGGTGLLFTLIVGTGRHEFVGGKLISIQADARRCERADIAAKKRIPKQYHKILDDDAAAFAQLAIAAGRLLERRHAVHKMLELVQNNRGAP